MTSRLPAVTPRQAVRALERCGWELDRTKGKPPGVPAPGAPASNRRPDARTRPRHRDAARNHPGIRHFARGVRAADREARAARPEALQRHSYVCRTLYVGRSQVRHDAWDVAITLSHSKTARSIARSASASRRWTRRIARDSCGRCSPPGTRTACETVRGLFRKGQVAVRRRARARPRTSCRARRSRRPGSWAGRVAS